jgi:hypothetical protein
MVRFKEHDSLDAHGKGFDILRRVPQKVYDVRDHYTTKSQASLQAISHIL